MLPKVLRGTFISAHFDLRFISALNHEGDVSQKGAVSCRKESLAVVVLMV
jgi:hypothetical protein